MDYFYYWPDYEHDTENQTKWVPKLHRSTDDILKIDLGDTVWCVVSIDRPGAPKAVALGAKIVAKKSASYPPSSHAHITRHGPHYFVDSRTGTEYYQIGGQTGLEEMLRKLSFPVNAEHVGGSFQGKNGFRRLKGPDIKAFQDYAAKLTIHPKITVPLPRPAGP